LSAPQNNEVKKEVEPAIEFPVPESEEKKQETVAPPQYEDTNSYKYQEPIEHVTNIPPPPEKKQEVPNAQLSEEIKGAPESKMPPSVPEIDYGKEFLELLMNSATPIEKRKQLVMW
jgi:hypothetical protein